MDLYSLAEGPLLWFALLVFTAGIGLRTAFFLSAMIRSGRNKVFTRWHIAVSIGRFFLPFHKAVLRKPVYAALRYIFHICLIVVPVWLSGHIALWEESRFEWSWTALPDVWADRMTLIVLGVATYFLLRRAFLSEIRNDSSVSDYILILMTTLPFSTGYFFTHGSLDAIPFFESHMMTIHILSAEAMLIGIVFLFYRTQLNVDTCTACAACEVICPTATLLSEDEGKLRTFSYHHYQCICCGACVEVCPEDAASLRHELKPVRFFQIFSRRKIRSVALAECKSCGGLFAPEPQLEKIRGTISADYIRICPKCKVTNCAAIVKHLGHKVRLRRNRQLHRE
jgi:Pyruvate/2-oxoacid:ferredoxin oxidoreductase delta subunit